jgi:hypothetical protein
MVVWNATAANGDECKVLAPAVRDLAAEVRNLAQDPGDPAVRQRAADGVLKSARRLRTEDRVRDTAHRLPSSIGSREAQSRTFLSGPRLLVHPL